MFLNEKMEQQKNAAREFLGKKKMTKDKKVLANYDIMIKEHMEQAERLHKQL